MEESLYFVVNVQPMHYGYARSRIGSLQKYLSGLCRCSQNIFLNVLCEMAINILKGDQNSLIHCPKEMDINSCSAV